MLPMRKKSLASIIMAGPMGKEAEMAPEHEPSEDKKPLHAAAQDILAAIEHKSAMDLAEALSAFQELADSEEESESPDEESAEHE